MNIIVYGCGERCDYFIRNHYIELDKIVGFIDADETLMEFYDRPVIRPEAIACMEGRYDYILVTTKDRQVSDQIVKTMKALDYPMDKVLLAYNYYPAVTHRQIHFQNDLAMKEISEKLYSDILEGGKRQTAVFQATYICAFDNQDISSVLGTGRLDNDKYRLDYTRYRTFELIVNELEERRIDGAIAELGVFKGAFSKLINQRMPDRKFYLYDSFEGFKVDEYSDEMFEEKNLSRSREELKEIFTYTSAAQVLRAMPHAEQCVVRKGYFPESIQAEDRKEIFAFVSIDVDLETPTYEGLAFFYPRLAKGGYLFVHDYNNALWEGIKRAVRRYEHDNGLQLIRVPICDQCGTLIIAKS